MSSPKFQPINIYNYLKQLGTTTTGHNILSLLKELLDNGFDADAKNIVLEKKETSSEDGKKCYRIIYKDDGVGMNQEDMFRCVQLYSENKKGGIGKFGIGGASSLVNWCDIEDTDYEKFIIIITKMSDGTTRSLQINWSKCKTLEDYSFQVENSYKENEKNAMDILKAENIDRGTYIIIQTSEKKYSEITEVGLDMDNYINIGTTYQNYFEKGATITLFDDNIKHFAIPESILSDSIQVEIFTRKTEFAFSAKVGKETISYKYDRHEKEKKIPYEDLEDNWKLLCDVSLKLEMPTGIYTPKIALHNNRRDDQFTFETWDSFIRFCKKNEITCEKEILYLAKNYIQPLYVVRKDDVQNYRTLGSLGIDVTHTHGKSTTINKYLKKQLSFKNIYDTKLSLVQQNKSVIEWTNTPTGLKKFIKKIINHWSKNKLGPKLDELDIKEQEIRNFNRPLEISLQKKFQYMDRMENNKFTNTYLNNPTPISAGHVILRLFKKRREQRELASIVIQRWFRNQNKTGGPTEGFIKFQRFIEWSHLYYNASKIQKWFKTILLKKAIINYLLSDICKRINARKSVYVIEKAWHGYNVRKNSSDIENNAAIVLQKYIRRYLATCAVKREKDKNVKYEFHINNFMNEISIPNRRHLTHFNKFKYDIINKLNELSKLL